MSARRQRQRKGRARKGRGRRGHVADRAPDASPVEDDWIVYGGQRIFVVGFTPGGAPFGYVEDVGPGLLEE